MLLLFFIDPQGNIIVIFDIFDIDGYGGDCSSIRLEAYSVDTLGIKTLVDVYCKTRDALYIEINSNQAFLYLSSSRNTAGTMNLRGSIYVESTEG